MKSQFAAVLSFLLPGVPSLCATDYTSLTLGTTIEGPRDLTLENVAIVNETDLMDGRVLLELSSDVRNSDEGVWSNVLVKLGSGAAEAGITTFPGSLVFDVTLGTGEVAASEGSLQVVVAAADLPAARAEILAGTIIQPVAEDLEGAVLADVSALVVENVRIMSEIPLVTGQVLVEFAADVRNVGEAVRMIRADPLLFAGNVGYALYSGFVQLVDNLAANAVASLPGPLLAIVETAALATARAELLAGEALSVAGRELWVFNAPPRGIDRLTQEAWAPPALSAPLGATTLVFSGSTSYLSSLQAGDLLIEDPGVDHLSGPDALDENAPVLADYVPFEVASVAVLGDEVRVTGHRKLLLDVIKSATFVQDARHAYEGVVRDPYNPDLENTYTESEKDDREEAAILIAGEDPRDGRLAELRGMNAIPWHLNDFELTEKIRLSGEFLLRSSGLQLEITIRDFALKRATAHLDAGAVMNFVVECGGREDNTAEPPEGKEKTIFDLDLPGVPFTIGGVPVDIHPVIYLKVGADANLPSSLTIPLQSAVTVGVDLGWDKELEDNTGNGFFYEPFQEIIPLRISDPTVFQDLAATASLWAEFGVGLEGGIVGLVHGGPSLGLRFQNDFTVAPLSDPWWAWEANLDVIGRFGIDFLGVDVFDAVGSLASEPVFQLDAGGPLLGGGGPGRKSQGGSTLAPLSAKNVRWARIFEPDGSFTDFDHGFVVSHPDLSGDFIVGGTDVTRTAVAKYSAEGDLLWAKDLGIQPISQEGAALPDGGFVTAGYRGFDLVVSRFDGDGNRAWTTRQRPSKTLTITDVAIADNGLGDSRIYVAGHLHHGTIASSDPAVVVFEPNGDLLWASYYELPGNDDEACGVIVAADGSLLLSGRTGADVAPPPVGIPATSNVLKDATSSGLLMKLDAADGAVQWANAYASRWGIDFEDLVEGPDGTIFAAGAAGRVVGVDRPVNLFAKITADGTLLDHVTVGPDPDWPLERENGGHTAYDVVSGLVWAEGGLWACGTTGLGALRAGWAMALTPELGLKFFSLFDGPDAEVFLGLGECADGIAVLGTTRSAYPWGVGGRGANLVMKLPWEGIMRFHEDSGLESVFVQPQVYHSSASLDFQMLSYSENPGAPQTFTNAQSGIPFVQQALTFTDGGTVSDVSDAAAPISLPLEKTERIAICSYDDWVAYHRLSGAGADPFADDDGDEVVNLFEAYLGRSPRVVERDPVMTITAGERNGEPVVVIEFDRAQCAAAIGVRFETSEELQVWLDAIGFSEEVRPLDSVIDHVTLVGPRDVPARFFRFASELAVP